MCVNHAKRVVVVAALSPLVAACSRSNPPRFVGAAACASCHAAEHEAWRGSQHARAMQDGTPANVLGRFDGKRFKNASATYTFTRRGDTSIVNAIGEDGALHDYHVRYTFGVWPLQQYLVALSRGRLQALPVAWDARPARDGGQRWFSLSPGVEPSHSDPFHWTGAQYNWNYMCADCHSTAVRKGYVADSSAFNTTFTAIDVGCESCHGPASRHLTWAKYPAVLRRFWHDDGLPSQLTERTGVHWSIDSTTGNAQRSAPRATDRELETCAQCHARRTHIADGYVAGAPFLDYYAPLPILPGLYHPDGQQLDEVYTYASFLQSKMNHAGVTCSDCHDPHTQKLRAPGNAVCAQCHRPAKYDTTAHHFHRAGSAGAQCVSCHMPDTAYMQIDLRRDHSIRIPRPDLSVSLGTPNACTRCHTDRDARWAAAAIGRRYPRPNPGFQRFAAAFAADDRNAPGAADSLARLANDSTEPWIVRASALARLAAHPGAVATQAARASVRDPNPTVRLYALQALENAGEQERLAIGPPLLTDSRRAVRQEAAWVLAPVARSLTTARAAFDSAARELIASERYNADRAPSRMRLATFFGELGRYEEAAAEIHAAERLDADAAARFVQAIAAAAPTSPSAAALLRAINARTTNR
jgi:Cytochrome c7 and related cytochrome c/Cytochrome c554 and c-prime